MSAVVKLKEAIAAKTADARRKFDDLVDRAARGEDVSPESALKILDAAGETADKFAGAVDAKIRRTALVEKAATRAGLEKELVAVQTKYDALDTKFAAVRKQQDDELGALSTERRRLTDALGEAGDAANELRRMPPPDVAERIREIEREIRALGRPEELKEWALTRAREADDLEDNARATRSPELRAKWNADAAEKRRAAISLNDQAAAARVRRDELSAEREAVERQAEAA